MAKYNDIEHFTDAQENIANHEGNAAAERTEIRRIHSGAEEDIADEDAGNNGEGEAEKEKKSKILGLLKKIEKFFTGDILITEEATRVYYFLVLLGGIFLISIFTMFATFQSEIRHNKLQTEVKLLKERAIRISEERAQKTSHTAITNELKRRNIKLEDPTATPIILR